VDGFREWSKGRCGQVSDVTPLRDIIEEFGLRLEE